MVNSYYGIYQTERGKTAAEIRVADAQIGGLAAELGQLGSALERLLLPDNAQLPARKYLDWHKTKVFIA